MLERCSVFEISLKFFRLCLEYFGSIFLTLTISSGVMNPVFKKVYFPSTKVYHKNYTENITLIEQFEN